ncbi:metallophosphoesterase family protein [Thalassobacillus pellis]|uniref:metallophosphoesterase family protein n=1 Tax=Thalassobacillus pellis TaxID=748008 RepID=UPI00195FB38F|nr:metallophosphoesterase family protein [Thalassobacillus pellis]MBM7553158.1 serine/threonine protein phosphatase 1 [Thalassobacillus pellis]
MRHLIVSDIHGEIGKLEKVLGQADYNPEEDCLVLLGDYVDRGPHSKEVVEKVKELVENDGAIAIKGNHDDLFIRSREDGEALELWKMNGAARTWKSYEDSPEKLEEHRQWMKQNLRLYYESDDYIFVHAGLEPKIAVEDQKEDTMLWTRHMEPIGLGKTVVHGHTPVEEVAYYNDQIDIDTGAAYGGKLSMLELPSHEVYRV